MATLFGSCRGAKPHLDRGGDTMNSDTLVSKAQPGQGGWNTINSATLVTSRASELHLGRGVNAMKQYFGNFEGGEAHLGWCGNTIDRDTLVTSRAASPTHLGRGGNTINSNTLVTSRVPHLGRGGNTINSETLVTSRAARPTWAGAGT